MKRTAGLRLVAAGLLALLGMPAFSAEAPSLYGRLDLAGIEPAPAGSPTLLHAARGITAISGRVLATNGKPLQGVRVTDGPATTETDVTGRFLLKNVASGESVAAIDARHAAPVGQAAADFGYYEMRVGAQHGLTSELPFVDWLTPIDHAHDVVIRQPLAKPVDVTTPSVPGLALRLPAGAILTGPDHKLVTHVGLTEISTRRPPFPLPRNVHVPVYFTAQPGGTVISSADGSWLGAQVVYPNYYHRLPHAQEVFWRYDPDADGWATYGMGTVTNDGRQVVPSKETRIYAFTGAMISGGPPLCYFAPFLCGLAKFLGGGDPVDLASGSFRFTHTDMALSDIMPISVERSYNSAGTTPGPFGAGMASSYDIQPMTLDNFASAILSLPNGGQVAYACTTPAGCGNSPAPNQQYTSSTPGEYYKSVLLWHATLFPFWTVTRTDGTVLFFPYSGGAQAVTLIRDRFGNTVTIARNLEGQMQQVTSSNGKSISFTWTNGVITKAVDNAGRAVNYGYDSNYQMLQTVTDPDSGVTTYGWNNNVGGPNNSISMWQINTVSDPRTKTFVANQYDGNFRVYQQTLADGASKYAFSYTLGSNSETDSAGLTEYNVTQTTVTDPNTNTRVLNWDANAYVLTDTQASNSATLAETTAYCRAGDAALNATSCPTIGGTVPAGYVSDIIDPLGRDTNYTYDGNANVLSVTYLAGSSNAAPCKTIACTYSYSYSAEFNQVSSITDPIQHTTQLVRGLNDELVSLIDAVGDTYSFGYNSAAQISSITDAMVPANTTTFGYTAGDLTSITDPLGRTTTIFTDVVGRPATITDPLNNTWRRIWDPIDGVHQTIDPLQNVTTVNFDPDGNVSSIVDANTHSTSYTYTDRDQVFTATDPKALQDQFTSYDANGNLKTWIDRKGQTVRYTYDALNRLSTSTYADGSVVSYTWDAGNRPTKISDTAGNTVSLFYDGIDDLVCATPNNINTLANCEAAGTGTVYYGYDAIGRRMTMNVYGQSQVAYNYDNLNRLKKITQGSSSVVKTYDADSRPQTLTLTNGIVATYGFDAASELRSIVYTKGSTTTGTLYYTYDSDGRVATRSGSLFQSVLPSAVSGVAYDADNRLCAWNSSTPSCSSPTITWDNNGNLLNDGSYTYGWDARNRLTSISGLNASYSYDALGRRLTNTLGSSATTYVYDFLNSVQEVQAGAASANLLTGLGVDERFARTNVSGGTTSSYLTDMLGSTAALASSSGTVATNYAYAPFGTTTVSGTADANTYQYTGRENDGTGLYYSRARYLKPAWGRFISEDPIGFAGGINKYAYTGNDPLNFMDPFGLTALGNVLGGVGTWGGRALGGAVGEGLDPLGGGIPGEILGGRLGGAAGQALGDALSGPITPPAQPTAGPAPGAPPNAGNPPDGCPPGAMCAKASPTPRKCSSVACTKSGPPSGRNPGPFPNPSDPWNKGLCDICWGNATRGWTDEAKQKVIDYNTPGSGMDWLFK